MEQEFNYLTTKVEIESDLIIKLQDLLINIDESNIIYSVSQLINSIYLYNYEKEMQLVHNIIIILASRPFKVKTMIVFLIELFNMIDHSKSFLKKLILHSISLPAHSNQSHLYFFRQLLEKQIYTKEEIISELLFFFNLYPEHKTNHCLLFAWFLPEIELISQDFFNKVIEFRNDLIIPFITEFFTNFEKIKNNNYFLWNELINRIGKNYSITAIIENDDYSSFIDQTILPNFSIDLKIIPSIFDRTSITQSGPTLIQYSSYCSSIKIFKFLFTNNADITLFDNYGINLEQYSIAGGNLEIIRSIENLNLSFHGTLLFASKSFRFELFKWIFFNKFPDFEIKSNIHSPLHESAASGNIQCFCFCLKNGLNPNLKLKFGWTPLHSASRNGQSDIIRILKFHPNIDINVQDQNGWSPLHWAVHDCHPNTVKILLQYNNINVNIKNLDGVSILLFQLLYIGLQNMVILI